MELIDEKGRLFGRVNVVDALVVLVVLAVVAAGVALVTGGGSGPAGPSGDGDGPDSEIRYATVAFGAQPSWFASAIQAGDNVTLAGSTASVNVTDVYLTSADDGQVGVFARISYPAGTAVGDSPIRAGRAVTVVGDGYQRKSTVRSVGDTSPMLRTATTPAVVTTTVESSTAAAIQTGDQFAVGNHTLATVESLASVPTNRSDERRLRIGLDLETLSVGGEPQFADRTLRVGTAVPLRTSGVDGFSGTVTGVGSLDPAGDATNVTMTVAWENVRPDVADAIATEMAESHRGATARVTALASNPATVVRANEAGELLVREHPRNRDVTLTVDATARQRGSELQFHGRSLSEGRTVTLEFESVTLRGTVLDFETNG
ncbi:protein of unknown function [Halorientalis persicus]|uniref:DUF4330 family protein n=1 Tax=Halorientalis persicus TaxID=1367881 RepID=A0A1H8QKS1_9EURY|nr:DUF4330 family protein [Halorientalis persicus]SEO54820.1 protein of unknown function [Halorientalis persicus]